MMQAIEASNLIVNTHPSMMAQFAILLQAGKVAKLRKAIAQLRQQATSMAAGHGNTAAGLKVKMVLDGVRGRGLGEAESAKSGQIEEWVLDTECLLCLWI